MTKSEYSELVEFLAKKFDAIDRRFDTLDRRLGAVETKLTKLEVGVEAMQVAIRTVAEGVVTNGRRLDRFESHFREDRLDLRRRLKALEN